MSGIVVPLPKPPRKEKNWAWWASLAMLGAIVLGLALLTSCGHSQIGKCGEGCTQDPEISGVVKACFDSPELGRVCAYGAAGDECAEFFLRAECGAEWEYKGTQCHLDSDRDHGS